MDTSHKDLIFDLSIEPDLLQVISGSGSAGYIAIVPFSESKPEDVNQLRAIFKSISIDFEHEVLTLALHTLSDSVFRLKEMYPAAGYFFLFGVKPSSLGMPDPLPLYSIVSLSDVKLLQSESMAVLQKSIDSKKKLWHCLKDHFINQ